MTDDGWPNPDKRWLEADRCTEDESEYIPTIGPLRGWDLYLINKYQQENEWYEGESE